MKVNSELYDLILTLTKSEKRYIRLYAENSGSGKIYMELFDRMEKFKPAKVAEGFDENRFKEQSKDEKFLKHYAFNKHYLYNLIIKCLVSYNEETSADAKLHRMIMQCKILFNKALYRQYFRSIKKAKDYALKYERLGYYLQILDMERIIIKKDEIQGNKSETIYNEAAQALQQLQNSFELGVIAARAYNNYRTLGVIRDEQQGKLVKKLLEQPALRSPDKLTSRSKETYYRIQEVIYDTTAEYDKKLEAQLNRYDTVQQDAYAFKGMVINYESDTLVSILDSLITLEKFTEAEDYLAAYKKSLVTSGVDADDIEIMSALIEFRLFVKKNEIIKAKKLVPVLEKILVKFNNKMLIDTELTIRYSLVKFSITSGDHKTSLKKINSLMAHDYIVKRPDYEAYLKILNLIIHFELKNYDLLKYLILSTYRFLSKRKKLYGLELVILEFIRKLPEVKDESDLNFNFIQFYKRLEELKKDNYEKNAFEYFDFAEWVKNKIS